MCTRYLLLERDYRATLEALDAAVVEEFLSRYNIAVSSMIPVVRAPPQKAGREAVRLRWGLVPSWSKTDEGARLANARAETVAEKPSFRDALRKRRCVIPASGFYEWEKVGRNKQPWLFRRRDESPFGFAGLWDRWSAPDGTTLETCTFITTEPNELMRPIHDRMPVMLAPADYALWLDPAVTEPAQLAPLLRPPPASSLSAITVGSRVGNVRFDDPSCLTPVAPQLSLDLQ